MCDCIVHNSGARHSLLTHVCCYACTCCFVASQDCGDHYEFVMEQLGVLEQMESGAMGAPGGRAGARGLVVRAGGAGGAGGGAAMERCDDGEVDEEWSDDEVDDDDAMGTA